MNPENLLAEYQEVGQMARLHGGYRFTMFGFLATLLSALAAGTYWLSMNNRHCLALLARVVGIVISSLAVLIDRRSMQLYDICEEHAAQIELLWRSTAPQGADVRWPERGVYSKLRTSRRWWFESHTFAFQTLYFVSLLAFVLLALSATWIRLCT
jgi:hypothetical protein